MVCLTKKQATILSTIWGSELKAGFQPFDEETFKTKAQKYVKLFESVYRNWCTNEINIRDKNPYTLVYSDQTHIWPDVTEKIAVLCVIWHRLDIKEPFPISAAEMKMHPYIKTELEIRRIV